MLCVVLFLFSIVSARDVWLSSGYGGWTRNEMDELWSHHANLVNQKAVSVSSLCMYYWDEQGGMGFWEHEDNKFGDIRLYQKELKNQLGMKAMPLFFCDETIGNCPNLIDRLEKVFERIDEFIQESIHEALKFGYDGYAVDIEPNRRPQPEHRQRLTNFLVAWSNRLGSHNMTLQLWTGGNGPDLFDYDELSRADNIRPIQTMETYTSYNYWESRARGFLDDIDPGKAGFGLLTVYAEDDRLKFQDSLLANGASPSLVAKKYNGLALTISDMISGTNGTCTRAKMNGSEGLKMTTHRHVDKHMNTNDSEPVDSADTRKTTDICLSYTQDQMMEYSAIAKKLGVDSLSVWASHVPKEWIAGLHDFINVP